MVHSSAAVSDSEASIGGVRARALCSLPPAVLGTEPGATHATLTTLYFPGRAIVHKGRELPIGPQSLTPTTVGQAGGPEMGRTVQGHPGRHLMLDPDLNDAQSGSEIFHCAGTIFKITLRCSVL